MEEIRNRVKESGIVTIDLGDMKPRIPIREIDLSDQLWQGLVLRERDFREWVKNTDWDSFIGNAIYVHCSSDAIIPSWAYMLVASELISRGISFVVGDRRLLVNQLIQAEIRTLDVKEMHDARIMIKGCADITDPEFAMTELMKKIQPIAKSIMYGEPCSSVPVFKRK